MNTITLTAAALLIADRGRIVEMYRRAMTVFRPNASGGDYPT